MWIDKLRAGERIIGTMIRMVRHSGVARIARNNGLDFIMLDMEHGECSMESASEVFRLARALGLGSFVRVPELAKGYVSRVMDVGANGVMVPMVDSVEQARALVRWTKFAPLGDRGLGGAGGHSDFAGIGSKAPEFMDRSNRETISIAQIETAGAVECVDEIATLPGIDALLVGPNDLSISLGVPGDLLGDRVDKAIGRIAAATEKAGKVFGMHGNDDLLNRWIPQGLTLVMSTLDINMVAAGMAEIRDKFGVQEKGE